MADSDRQEPKVETGDHLETTSEPELSDWSSDSSVDSANEEWLKDQHGNRQAAMTDQQRKDIRRDIVSGRSCPPGMNLRAFWIRRAIVHGIRFHKSFADFPEVAKLCIKHPASRDSIYTRAHYARMIMNNVIPDMDPERPDTFPYCIWYPEVASEQTYRDLVKQYPNMRYQVGRACAVAGYETLYHELDIYPDVCIAEEAQASPRGQAIFESIMSCPSRYRIMNDYERTIDLDNKSPTPGAFLTADTSVCLYLDGTTPCESASRWRSDIGFDILEDDGIGEDYGDSDFADGELTPEQAALFYRPIPFDLPAINKDLLILYAAYEGNLDRYVFFARPKPIWNEVSCVARGCYYSTTFAKYFSEGIGKARADMMDMSHGWTSPVSRAVCARRIMANDLTWHRPEWTNRAEKSWFPYLIWFPQSPGTDTLEHLAQIQPAMHIQIAHACIALDYESLYRKLKFKLLHALFSEAKESRNPFYLQDLERRKAASEEFETDRSVEKESSLALWAYAEGPKYSSLDAGFNPSSIQCSIDQATFGRYCGAGARGETIELYIASSLAMRQKACNHEDRVYYPHLPYPDDEEEQERGEEKSKT